MKVKLTKTILAGSAVKTIIRKNREPIVFVKGAVIEMSETSAKKYIDAGDAEACPDEPEERETQTITADDVQTISADDIAKPEGA